jgi:hypothetical protein
LTEVLKQVVSIPVILTGNVKGTETADPREQNRRVAETVTPGSVSLIIRSEIFTPKVQCHINQPNHRRRLDQRANYGRKGLPEPLLTCSGRRASSP